MKLLPLTLPACGLSFAWLLYLASGRTLAAELAHRFGDQLASLANGKFPDSTVFIQYRLMECLILITLAFVLLVSGRWLIGIIHKTRSLAPANGLLSGLLVFVLLNILIWAAGNTVVFWTLFYNRERVDNTAQFHIKNTLLGETRGRKRVILMGNSQANRSIDEKTINRTLGDCVWTTELTQPGARGFDLFTIARSIPFRKDDLVIFYVSEISFYGEGSGISAAHFMGFRELAPAWKFGAKGHLRTDAVWSGLCGTVFPLMRFNSSVSPRILGGAAIDVKQNAIVGAIPQDLEVQAAQWAPKLKVGGASEFEQAAFSSMVDELAAKGCQILLIEGNLHPSLESRMNPEIHSHFETFLTNLRAKNPSAIAVIGNDTLIHATGDDFTDLVHFTDAAQQKFTTKLANLLTSWNVQGISAFHQPGI